jgi:Fe-S oxidoreductase
MRSRAGRAALTRMGIHPERSLSPYATETFEAWWKQHKARRDADNSGKRLSRGEIIYFHDTFTTYNYPRIGRAVVRLLEAAGFDVVVETRRECCGRPMLSKGLVDDARKLAQANVALLAPYARRGLPIIGSEPSCILTLRDEYLDLLPGNPDASAVASQAFMIDEFLTALAQEGTLGITWRSSSLDVLFHGHCHQKAVIGMGPSMALLRRAGLNASESGAGCCGMAGSFGYEAEHYDVSRKIGEERLFPKVNATDRNTVIAVAGVSCRQQIEHFTGRKTKHIAEVLAEHVMPGHVWSPTLDAAD